MGYHIDLEKISIDQYRNILKTNHLIPSWRILLESVDENLLEIKKLGIHNLGVLQAVLKKKDQLSELSKQSEISESYLLVLRRMVNGYHPKPQRIKDFPDTPQAVISKLKNIGVKNTRHLFDRIKTAKNRLQLSEETGISEKEIMRLTKLTDLSRIRWVNHTFAYVLYETGYDTLEKMADADPEVLYAKVKKLNAERKFYPAHIGLNDMKMLVEGANMLSIDIQYSWKP